MDGEGKVSSEEYADLVIDREQMDFHQLETADEFPLEDNTYYALPSRFPTIDAYMVCKVKTEPTIVLLQVCNNK